MEPAANSGNTATCVPFTEIECGWALSFAPKPETVKDIVYVAASIAPFGTCAMTSIVRSSLAEEIIVPIGTCSGQTLKQVAERRPASLKWYVKGYSGDDNILRAGAKLMLDKLQRLANAS